MKTYDPPELEFAKSRLRRGVSDHPKWDLAVVACDGRGQGCVIACAPGSTTAEEISNCSSRLDSLGLDDAPLGVSIWSGHWEWQPGGYECPQDGSSYAVGAFRPPTDEEWQAIRDGRFADVVSSESKS